MKMLQLALALSLLHVDTDYSLLQQQLRRWDAQLELPHGDGNWELEMLRTVPMIETQHPYGNRKGMTPLIEDLLRFDEPHPAAAGGEYKLPTGSFNASTFVMNLHNTTGNSSVQTAALQDLQSNPSSGAAGAVGVGATTATDNVGASAALGEIRSIPQATIQRWLPHKNWIYFYRPICCRINARYGNRIWPIYMIMVICHLVIPMPIYHSRMANSRRITTHNWILVWLRLSMDSLGMRMCSIHIMLSPPMLLMIALHIPAIRAV